MLKTCLFNSRWILFFVLCLYGETILSQNVTIISGIVQDAKTKEALSFVNLTFQDTQIGTFSELDGTYQIETAEKVSALVVSYVGYEEKVIAIEKGKTQYIKINLIPSSADLEEVIVRAKKERYSKKNNPAVDLMRQVMAHKKSNGLNGQAFYQFNQYEKVEVDINHLSEKFRKRKVFKPFEFVWNYLDSTDTDSKPFLPILLKETNSTTYYRASTNTKKEYIHATKTSKLDKSVDQNNLTETINTLYRDIDIYDNNIILLRNQFLSPLAPLAIDFYRFYIVDTIELADHSVINLSFIPKNQANFGFTGNLYVSNDGTFQVMKIDMGIFGDININFIRDIKIEQEFQSFENTFVLKKNKVMIDYGLTEEGIGMLGTKAVHYDSYSFKPPNDPTIFDGIENTIIAGDAEEKGEAYWGDNRMVELTKREAGIYHLVDTMATIPIVQRYQKWSDWIVTEHIPVGKIDIGPYMSFVSFNNIEGFRVRFGGETNFKFSKKFLLQAYAAYGFKDEAFKYAGHAYYSFKDDYLQNPRQYFHVSYARETGFPGLEDNALSESSLFLSFQWGEANKMILFDIFKAEYVKETKSLTYGISYTNTYRQPYGTLSFEKTIDDIAVHVESVNSSEVGLNFRFAPNQQFTISGKNRIPIYNKYPILTFEYDMGIKDVWGGDYNYHRLSASIFKKFRLSILGHTNIQLSAGKIFGEVPYVLMHIPRANQTYAYQTNSYNLMSFIEFAGDQYIDVNLRHYFKGFFFNRIPLLKKLKLREVLSAKMVWGSVSDKNNPTQRSELVQFPTNELGIPTTYALSGKPYAEIGFGISNILKFGRIDLVQRLTYLDHPNVPSLFNNKGLGIRARIDFEF